MEGTSDCNPKDNQALFKSKKYLLRVMTTKKCDLKNDDVKVWSTLVYKARDRKPITIKEIASRTGLDRGQSGKKKGKPRGIPLHLAKLVKEGLARKVKGGYVAKEPTDSTREWFAWKDKGDEWWDRLARYPVFSLATGVKSKGNQKGQKTAVQLTQSASDLYFLLVSLAKWKDKVYGQSQSGLAKMLGISRRTVYATLHQLQRLQLVSCDHYTFTLSYPREALNLWQERKTAQQPGESEKSKPRSEKPAPKQPSGLIDKERLAEAARQKWQGLASAEDLDLIVSVITRYHTALTGIGYTSRDLDKMLDALTLADPASDRFILYLCAGGDFINDIREAGQIHKEKGKRQGASSVDVLVWKINQRFKPRPAVA